MKSNNVIVGLCLTVWLAMALGWCGCASTKAHDTESLLSAAGFHSLTPRTAQQQACYAALPDRKLQRTEYNGRTVYAFADKKAGVVYVGGEQQYQRFNQLAVQQRIAQEQMETAQMNQDAAMNWGYWGPGGVWW